MQQLGLFSTDDNKAVKPKRAKQQSKQIAMFSNEEMTGKGKLTELHSGYRPTMALTKQDPRTEEQKDSDRRADALAKTLSLWSAS